MLQLAELAAEVNGALQILQRDELNKPHVTGIAVLPAGAGVALVIIPGHRQRPVLNSLHRADKEISMLTPDELLIVRVPAVGDGGAVGDDEHHLRFHPKHQIVNGKGLAEARLGVPEEFSARMGGGIVTGLCNGVLLLGAQRVRRRIVFAVLDDAAIGLVFIEALTGLRHRDFDVLRAVDLFITQLVEVGAEIIVCEGLAAAIVKNGAALPLDLLDDVHRMPLLMDAILHGLPVRVADLQMAIVPRNLRRGIGVHHGNDPRRRLDADGGHVRSSPLHGIR